MQSVSTNNITSAQLRNPRVESVNQVDVQARQPFTVVAAQSNPTVNRQAEVPARHPIPNSTIPSNVAPTFSRDRIQPVQNIQYG